MYKIYIIEDDANISRLITEQLTKYQFQCYTVQQFHHIVEEFQTIQPHLVVMDINLPTYDGYFWSRKIRQLSTCPIIIVSARINDIDQVYGIENGADDFMTKPFSLDVFMAKVNGLIRRTYGEYASSDSSIITIANTTLNTDTVRLQTAKQESLLTLKEMQLCKLLFDSYPNVVTRQELLSAIWDDETFVEENTLSVNIGRLRKKFEVIQSLLEIKTIRGLGYQLVEVEE
ncbi:response regulator transcription factor [Lysinibacillus pakistanensis]|uniref:Response regulator transcription factor n=1 Tax=Lysinibacillus pakistanensis TaxID=759811 RepID=A0AAX3WW68_9BACI|nr:response regulator transcription factor [Lysinibacillus pakistanensis]MDM5231513.1 response regulator transcription factor [Lysinibacillus pakistanensis]WHY47060.1 response regulator transcription factor [Lysinibacillus pakistanensis]WHY52071.1 response regulator transcription factor [Lysinibacillus pakistanensis]